MKKPIIAVDIDDVLANSTESLRQEVNKRLGVELSPEDYLTPGDYNAYYENVWRAHGLEGRLTMDELDPQMKADQSHVLPHLHAADVLEQLKSKYEFIIVTGRSSNWREATERWLDKYFSDIFSKVLFGDGYEGLRHKSKGELCAENGAAWLIDDNVEHARSARDKGVKVILFGQYGWHHKAPAEMTRCKDWAAVLEYFDERC